MQEKVKKIYRPFSWLYVVSLLLSGLCCNGSSGIWLVQRFLFDIWHDESVLFLRVCFTVNIFLKSIVVDVNFIYVSLLG